MGSRTTAILDKMAGHRRNFEAFCRSLTPKELATQVPDAPWTVHDYIAHLCTIDTLINRFFGPLVGMPDIPQPEVAPPVPFDIDDWNGAIVTRRTNTSLDKLFAEAAAARANYARILESLPDDRLEMMIPPTAATAR